MNLGTFLATITASVPDEWETVSDGPPTVYRSEVVSCADANGRYVEVERVEWLACFKEDIDISIGTGISQARDFREPWANNFPDPHAESSYLDFFYRGALVYREIIVDVDGGRASLPLPDRQTLTVPSDAYRRARLVAGICGDATVFDDYFRRAGLTTV